MPQRAPIHRQPGWRPRGYDIQRGSAASRGYDRAWTKVRNAFIKAHPLCQHCEAKGLVVAASEVDHVIPIPVDPSRRLDPTNLSAICRSCHRAKTAADQRQWYGSVRVR
ncbi:MAG TPA: HNH endonuclease signature motif containing protein [Stellaceae bacterium]|nr:HNH endonuclease signature motif containing protein [Stellaceae bacterium]